MIGVSTKIRKLMPKKFQIKDETEKTRFFSGLTNEKLDTFPKDVCTKKILPELLKAFDYSNAGAQIIAPVFKVHETLWKIIGLSL